ncbi:MAG: D-cysteine desulfhydrase family protein [Deltaproteobacteria bacterium]|nr:D-cysteine desulfhydrase family protein [Deltaproteobacteria bacterium]
MKLKSLPRIELAQLPTPLQELPRLGQLLGGPKLLVKRDDQTGLALGGNKTRKLEFLIADALKKGADTVITTGAPQSNHCRQTAAAAAQVGMGCELVLGGNEPEVPNGNVLLDLFCGANLHWTTRERRNAKMDEVARQLLSLKHNPYIIPVGGSNGLGALGYVQAMIELNDQLSKGRIKVDTIVFATSSGGTQAGMVVGARISGFEGKILGISIDQRSSQEPSYQSELAAIANEAAKLIDSRYEFTEDDFTVNYDYLGLGYGVVGNLERESIRLTACTEGLLLDPVYSGRAMGGLVDLIKKGFFSLKDTVLYWHTGGAPALFAYARELTQIRH